MQFAVGYQLPDEDERPFAEVLEPFAGDIAEVYFPWPGDPSGRSPMATTDGLIDWTAQERLETDLRRIRAMGARLDLLFNAACYGADGMSKRLANRICSTVAHIGESVGLDVVTTTSPFIARILQEHFPEIDVRASVNMRIGSIKGMEYVADLFDSFAMQREQNRNLERIAELKAWCDARGKGLVMLANSGCLRDCSGQSYHDNLVAHERDATAMDNVPGWNPSVCWRYYARPENRVAFLQNTWVRPEDLHHYDALFPVVKLATRMHANPARVIRAYVERRFRGNLMDLLEPGHSPIFDGYIVDNTRFPDDWFERTSACDKHCERCAYCAGVLERVLVKVEGPTQPSEGDLVC